MPLFLYYSIGPITRPYCGGMFSHYLNVVKLQRNSMQFDGFTL